MAYQGEYFVERYGAGAAEATPPVKRMLEKGVKVSAGTDATRVASYNPWVSLSWLVTGKTVGGLQLYPQRNCLDRETALRMWTENVTWFSNEEGKKGRIEAGQLADLIVPDRDFFACPESEIADTTALLTMVGGKVVYGAGDFAPHDEGAPPPAMPDWSPVRRFGGYGGLGRQGRRAAADDAAPGGGGLRLRQRLQRARPRARDGLEQQAADRPTSRASGARSAAPAGRCDAHALRPLLRAGALARAARLLCAAYLQGGLQQGAATSRRAIAEMNHFGLSPAAPLAVAVIVLELGAAVLILTGVCRWLGALALARLHADGHLRRAALLGDAAGQERFMAANAFFEHLGLVGGFVLVAWHDLQRAAPMATYAHEPPRPAAVAAAQGSFAPLRQPVFAVLWAATVLGNIGSFMRDVASAWMVTDLSASPTAVALIQTAATLPIFLLAIPAGVLSDILDRRRFLIFVQLVLAAVSGTLLVLSQTGTLTVELPDRR